MQQMEREIRQLQRGISIRENLNVEHSYHKGAIVPGLSTGDWRKRLAYVQAHFVKRKALPEVDDAIPVPDEDDLGINEEVYEQDFGF